MAMVSRRRLRAIASRLGLEPLYERAKRLLALDPRRLRRAAAFRRWNRGAAGDEIVLRPGLRLRIDPRSRAPFEHFCFRSLEMAGELDAFVRQMRGRSRLLDVGACHGIFALAFVQGRPAARALAVEPSPTAFEILAGNAARNGLANVEPVQAALGAGPGSIRMRANWHHLEALGEGESDAGAIAVPVSSLDDLCAERRFRPDLVKIDVEGFEHAVLRGALGVLGRERPLLFLEVHPERLEELGSSAAEVAALLASLGYRRLGGGRLDWGSRGEVFRTVCAVRGAEAQKS
jgi:FkbM family methyltransferase